MFILYYLYYKYPFIFQNLNMQKKQNKIHKIVCKCKKTNGSEESTAKSKNMKKS